MLKKMIPLGLAISMLTPTIAKAETLTSQMNLARAPYVSQLKSERQKIKANYDTNQLIQAAINGKLTQIKTLITQDKANKTLKDKKDILEAQRSIIRSDIGILKGININLSADRQSAKTDRTNKNYGILVNTPQNIPSLQTGKTPVLQKLSSDLDKLISLLNN